MNPRKITIKHASGVYTLYISSDDFDKVYKKITNIIKGRNRFFKYKLKDGSVTVYPVEMLRESAIIFESQKINMELLPQGI